MISIDNPIVPKEAKDLIEYVETTFNFMMVAYPSHIRNEKHTTNFFFTQNREKDATSLVWHRVHIDYTYDYYTYNIGGFKIFGIKN